jgi:hypothetical protein
MPFGAPDFSNIRKEALVHRLDDLAEASVRTFIPIVYDRLGDVIYFDSFESGFVWPYPHPSSDKIKFYVGYGCGLMSDRALVFKILAGHSGLSRIRKNIPFYSSYSLGMSLNIRPSLYMNYIQIEIDASNGTDTYTNRVRLYKTDGSIQVITPDGYQAIGSIPPQTFSVHDWLFVKFVVNLRQERWERVIVNRYSLSARLYTLRKVSAGGAVEISLYVGLDETTSADDWAFFDNVIVTINEPVSD